MKWKMNRSWRKRKEKMNRSWRKRKEKMNRSWRKRKEKMKMKNMMHGVDGRNGDWRRVGYGLIGRG